jgi:hypothetical protein
MNRTPARAALDLATADHDGWRRARRFRRGGAPFRVDAERAKSSGSFTEFANAPRRTKPAWQSGVIPTPGERTAWAGQAE